MNKTERNLKIKELYESGNHSKQIGKIFGLSHQRVRIILNEMGVQTRRRKDYVLFDKEYFREINTEEKAYILGMMFADGCNTKGHICLTLHEKDEDILKKIAEAFSYKGTFTRTKDNTIGFKLCSKEFSEHCKTLGLIETKSLILKYPTASIVSDELQRHFIRGYFDGDGCLYIGKPKRMNKCTILGTEEFLKKLNQIVSDELGFSKILELHPNKITRRYNIYKKADLKSFFDWIYKDATIYMERKYQKYLLL